MRRNYIVIVSLILFAGCTGKRTPVAETADSTAQEVPIAQLFYPDTAYASVKSVECTVDHGDSLPADLKDLDDRYEKANGIFVFRKNLHRNADFGGKIKGTPDTIITAWEFETAYDTTHTRFGTWGGGSGWTGQPLYMHWTDDQMALFRKSSKGLTPDFGNEEIFVGSLCGKGYFINYLSGKASREPLDLGNVVKGTPSMDPEYYNLYVGQGSTTAGRTFWLSGL